MKKKQNKIISTDEQKFTLNRFRFRYCIIRKDSKKLKIKLLYSFYIDTAKNVFIRFGQSMLLFFHYKNDKIWFYVKLKVPKHVKHLSRIGLNSVFCTYTITGSQVLFNNKKLPIFSRIAMS